MDLVELRARVRAMARNPEEAAQRLGLPASIVRALMAGTLRPSGPVAERIAKGVRP